mgnify:CR=1 FL=1
MGERPSQRRAFSKKLRCIPASKTLPNGLTTLRSTLGRLQRVDLGGLAAFRLDVGSKVAATVEPLLGGVRVAATELLLFKRTNAITAFALFNDGLHQHTLHFNALLSLDGTHEGFFVAHDNLLRAGARFFT